MKKIISSILACAMVLALASTSFAVYVPSVTQSAAPSFVAFDEDYVVPAKAKPEVKVVSDGFVVESYEAIDEPSSIAFYDFLSDIDDVTVAGLDEEIIAVRKQINDRRVAALQRFGYASIYEDIVYGELTAEEKLAEELDLMTIDYLETLKAYPQEYRANLLAGKIDLVGSYNGIVAADSLVDLFGDEYLVYHLFNMTPVGTTVAATEKVFAEGKAITVSMPYASLIGADTYVAVKTADGWKILDDSLVVVGEDSLTISLYELGPVAILWKLNVEVESDAVIDGEIVTSPATSDAE